MGMWNISVKKPEGGTLNFVKEKEQFEVSCPHSLHKPVTGIIFNTQYTGW